MRGRCLVPSNKAWVDYGAKGIGICERWGDFSAFEEDMGPTYALGLSIERDDVSGDYEPSNCRWIPLAHQARNRSITRWIETPWGRLPLKNAAHKIGLSPASFAERLKKGWTGEKLFSPPNEMKQRAAKCPSFPS